jgi:hypothetical protein
MRTSVLGLVLVAALAACSSKSKGASPPGSGSDVAGSGSAGSGSAGSGSATEGSGSAAQSAGPKMGEPCDADDHCATGLACVKYYGIAGPSGPEFKSCEMKCENDKQCPDGHRCAMIADGPGHVCR